MIPRKIYLQWVGDSDEPAKDSDAIRSGDVTWSMERVFKHDLVYVNLSLIGAKGGSKSKRKLTKAQARKMAAHRHGRVKAEQAGASAHERTTKERSGAGR